MSKKIDSIVSSLESERDKLGPQIEMAKTKFEELEQEHKRLTDAISLLASGEDTPPPRKPKQKKPSVDRELLAEVLAHVVEQRGGEELSEEDLRPQVEAEVRKRGYALTGFHNTWKAAIKHFTPPLDSSGG